MKTLLTIRFIGTAYHGFQVQQNALSVCEVLQNAMEKIYGVRPPVKGCSRTDAGVHALEYCVSYTQPKPIELRRLPLALNRYLPAQIKAVKAKEVNEAFHARYDAASKEYLYRLRSSAVDDPFSHGLVWLTPLKLNLNAMLDASKILVGTHNFAAFMSAGGKVDDTIRTIYFLNIKSEGDEIHFHICADGYLYNMVRIIVGTLVKIGCGQLDATQMNNILASNNRALAGETAPAQGLYLYKVNYDART